MTLYDRQRERRAEAVAQRLEPGETVRTSFRGQSPVPPWLYLLIVPLVLIFIQRHRVVVATDRNLYVLRNAYLRSYTFQGVEHKAPLGSARLKWRRTWLRIDDGPKLRVAPLGPGKRALAEFVDYTQGRPIKGPFTPPLAPYLKRVAALIADAIVILPITVPLAVLAVVIGVPLVTAAIGPLVYAFYASWAMSRAGERNGQTIGKQMLGIRVTRDDGRQFTRLSALYREGVAKMLLWTATAGVWAVIDCLFPLWDAEAEAYHDGMADTHVVAAESAAEVASGAPAV